MTHVTLKQGLHLTVEDKNHKAPVASQKVRPELVIDRLDISAKVRALNIRFLLSHVELLMKRVHECYKELMRVVLPPALKLLINFA